MSQLFHHSFNTIAKASIIGGLALVAVALGTLAVLSRSPYVTKAKEVKPQPVPFSHFHHVKEIGIDCRFCHTTADKSAFAGIPPTETCMTCHSQLFTDSPMLKPVHDSFRTGNPIPWVRVNDLPDFVYFDHSIHLKKGVGCTTCHGPVDTMPLTWRHNAMDMAWCLECHRNPEKFVRPPDQVFSTTYKPTKDQADLGAWLVDHFNIKKNTNCTVCHR